MYFDMSNVSPTFGLMLASNSKAWLNLVKWNTPDDSINGTWNAGHRKRKVQNKYAHYFAYYSLGVSGKYDPNPKT